MRPGRETRPPRGIVLVRHPDVSYLRRDGLRSCTESMLGVGHAEAILSCMYPLLPSPIAARQSVAIERDPAGRMN
jgi:hypothetical protein